MEGLLKGLLNEQILTQGQTSSGGELRYKLSVWYGGRKGEVVCYHLGGRWRTMKMSRELLKLQGPTG